MTLSVSERITRALARATAERLSRRAVARLAKMRHLLSGEDSELTSTWDEICVQVQGEESHFWGAYEHAIHDALALDVSSLPEHAQQALWLLTPEGEAWEVHHGDAGANPPVSHEDIVHFLTRGYVLPEAGRWTNKRIRAFLDRASRRD